MLLCMTWQHDSQTLVSPEHFFFDEVVSRAFVCEFLYPERLDLRCYHVNISGGEGFQGTKEQAKRALANRVALNRLLNRHLVGYIVTVQLLEWRGTLLICFDMIIIMRTCKAQIQSKTALSSVQ